MQSCESGGETESFTQACCLHHVRFCVCVCVCANVMMVWRQRCKAKKVTSQLPLARLVFCLFCFSVEVFPLCNGSVVHYASGPLRQCCSEMHEQCKDASHANRNLLVSSKRKDTFFLHFSSSSTLHSSSTNPFTFPASSSASEIWTFLISAPLRSLKG